MKNKKLNYTLINLAALMLVLYVGLSNIGLWSQIFIKIFNIMLPFIIAFGASYALYPLSKKLERRKINKTLANIIIILVLVIIVVGLLVLVVPLLYDQIKIFIKSFTNFVNNLDNSYNINLGSFEIKITDFLEDTLKTISGPISNTTIDVLSTSVGFLSSFIVGFVAFVYFLLDMDNIRKRIKEISLSINKRIFNYLRLLDDELGNYLKGLLLFMIIQLFEYSILFFIVGHPNWLLLGIVASITTVIPYFGGLITNIIAILLASTISLPLTILTVIICLIFPQLDGYVISPKIYGKTNNINPLITIMVVSVGGTLAGVLGIIIALPVYLLIRTTYHFFKKDINKGVSLVKDYM